MKYEETAKYDNLLRFLKLQEDCPLQEERERVSTNKRFTKKGFIITNYGIIKPFLYQ